MENNNQHNDFLGGQGLFGAIGDLLSDPEKRKKRLEKKDAKNKLKDSEANLNNALAQQAASQGQGMSTGAILGITLGVVAILGLITAVAVKSKK